MRNQIKTNKQKISSITQKHNRSNYLDIEAERLAIEANTKTTKNSIRSQANSNERQTKPKFMMRIGGIGIEAN